MFCFTVCFESAFEDLTRALLGPFFLHSSEHESQHAHGCLQHTAAQTLAAGIHNYGIAICALSDVLDSHRFKMLRAVRVFDAEAIGSFQLW